MVQLTGHTHPVAAVAFVQSGEVLASYSAEGACVKAWKAGSSGVFGGILGIQGRCLSSVPLQKLPPSQSNAHLLKNCKLKWVSTTTVLLVREDGSCYNIKLV